MPIYEYRCLKCKKNFEALVFGSNDKITCPKCESKKLERLMSSFGFKSGGGVGVDGFSSSSGSSGCSSCSSGSCNSCH